MRFRPAAIGLVAFCLGVPGPVLGANSAAPDYAKERAEFAQELTRPFDWLSLVALEWLKPGITTVGSAPGNTLVLRGIPAHALELEQKDGTVTVRQAAPTLLLGGKRLVAGTVLPEGETEADAVSTGTVRLWAINRTGRRYLRVKDSDAPTRRQFHGLRWYAPDARYRIAARWTPFPQPHRLTTHNQIGQSYETPVPGYVEFTVDGKTERLLPFTAGESGLFFVFRDETYRTATYGGGRFLSAEKPTNGYDKPGSVMLDFNEATNPPCAYTPYATCPLASPENRLAVPIPAGEKRYADGPEESHPGMQ